jgi:hypothetical protein
MQRLISLALCLLGAASAAQLRAASPGDVVVGHLKGLVDGYLDKYKAEEVSFKEADKAMQGVVDATEDIEAKARVVDEKLKLKSQHEEKLAGLAGFVRTLDGAVQKMKPGDEDWKASFGDLKANVDKIYEAHPALLAKTAHVGKIATDASAQVRAEAAAKVAEAYLAYLGSKSKAVAKVDTTGGPDVVIGHLKGLVDGYLDKYKGEEAAFAEADKAMQGVVDATEDIEAKARVVDEKLKLKAQHEEKLAGFAGFTRTLDDALQKMKPGDEDWKAKWPDMQAKVTEIFEKHPAALLAKGSAKVVVAKEDPAHASANAKSAADAAEIILAYL